MNHKITAIVLATVGCLVHSANAVPPGGGSAVAEVNGKTVIVGYGYTKKDAIMRAVYWQSNEQGSFGPPARLAGLEGNAKSLARATDINASGRVVGYAGSRTNSLRKGVLVTVMWTLP